MEPDDVSTARERLRGYREALEAAGIPFDPELVVETSGARTGGHSAMHQILSLQPLPTAVFAINNTTALGAAQAIRERGLAIPADMALVCFDDVEHLTVMNQPTETFGTVGTQLLLDRITGRSGDRPRQVVLQAQLLVRESCGVKGGRPSSNGA
jgi:LacI family transcriptional regulator